MTPRTFPAATESVAEARRDLRALLSGAVPDEEVEVAVLLVSELASNAVRHARSPFTVSAVHHASTVRVEVEDASAQLPEVQRPSPDATTGRGMLLVDALAATWGSESTAGGKRVWFELGGAGSAY